MRNYNTLNTIKPPIALALVLGLMACGSQKGEHTDNPSDSVVSSTASETPSNEPSIAEVPTQSIQPVEGVTFQFDYLEDGSQTVMVYPGPGDSPSERDYNGTYEHGQEADIYCIEPDGRNVASVEGETPRESNDWYLVDFNPNKGEAKFATAVYGNVIGDALIPNCADILFDYSE